MNFMGELIKKARTDAGLTQAVQIVNTLKALLSSGIPTACLIIDGLNFSKVKAEDIKALKDYAAEAEFFIWAT